MDRVDPQDIKGRPILSAFLARGFLLWRDSRGRVWVGYGIGSDTERLLAVFDNLSQCEADVMDVPGEYEQERLSGSGVPRLEEVALTPFHEKIASRMEMLAHLLRKRS